MRLDKFLGDQNIGTRKQIKEYIKNGRCKVNGVVTSKPDLHIDEEKDEILFDEEKLSYSRFHYFMLYKPQGVVSTTKAGSQRTVIDLLSGENTRGLSPCGRLDADTEGLLLITDDGELIHRLLSPKKHVDKVYEVHLQKELSEGDIEKLETGVDIGDKNNDGTAFLTLPSSVRVCEKDEEGNPVILLTIHEGRFHQIKRMLNSVDNEVLFLKRLSMGSLKLDKELLPGQYRELTERELQDLKR